MDGYNVLEWCIDMGHRMLDGFRVVVDILNVNILSPYITPIFGEVTLWEFLFGAALPTFIVYVVIKFVTDIVL